MRLVILPLASIFPLAVHGFGRDGPTMPGDSSENNPILGDAEADPGNSGSENINTAEPALPFPDNGCDPNWEQTAQDYNAAYNERWSNPSCYSFTLYNGCFCPSTVRGPHDIVVQDGVIVSPSDPDNEMFLVTMNDIFAKIYNECIANCPDEGADRCEITYAPEGYVTSAFIDISEQMADEETRYEITNFQLC